MRLAGRKMGGTPGARSPYVPLTRYLGGLVCPRPFRASGYSASPLSSGKSPGGSEMMERVTEASPRFMARIAGVFYLLNVVTSLFAFSGSGTHWMAAASGHIATACYIAVTVLFYSLFKPVNRSLSLAAAFFGLVACAIGSLEPLASRPLPYPQPGVFRILLPADRLPHLEVGLPASNSGRADGDCRLGLADLSVTAVRARLCPPTITSLAESGRYR